MSLQRLFKLRVVVLMVLMLCFSLNSAAATRTVTSLADDGTVGTLRNQIAAAASSGDTIVFSVTGTITLTQGFLLINKTLTITGPGAASLTISGNNTTQVFNIVFPGALTISGVTIANGNAGTTVGNAGVGYGGAIFNGGGNLMLANAAITGNTAGLGGGLANFGTATVTATTFSGNTSPAGGPECGGAIFNGSGTLTLTNSTVSGNFANFCGGGVHNNSGATASLINVTLSGNTTGCLGGGIFNQGPLTLSNSTLSGNSANCDGGGVYQQQNAGTLSLKSTLVAHGLSGTNCALGGGNAVFASSGYNLSDDASCTSFFNQTTDLNNTAAGLDAGLANNGGPTQTIALLAGSPAINAIPTAACTDVAGSSVGTDQRGIQRPQGEACDIGAFEAGAMAATSAGTNVSSNLNGGSGASGGVSVTFSNVTTAGTTTVTTTTSGPVPPDGFKLGNPPITYDLSTTAVFSGSITVCFNYTGITFNNAPKLFHYQGGSWVNVTTSVNTTTKVVCGSVTSLSPFGIFEEDQQVLPAVDLAVRKAAPILARTGRNLVYGIGVVNLGPEAASGVVLTDPLPAGTTFVGAAFGKASCSIVNRTVVGCSTPTQPTPCSFAAGKVTCNIGDLQKFTTSHPTGAVALITIRVTAAAGATLTNTATVGADNLESKPANNSSTARTKVTY